MSGSPISSTRTPQITPVMSFRDGFSAGASAKNLSKSVPCSSCVPSSLAPYPVSQRRISSTSSFVRPFLSALLT